MNQVRCNVIRSLDCSDVVYLDGTVFAILSSKTGATQYGNRGLIITRPEHEPLPPVALELIGIEFLQQDSLMNNPDALGQARHLAQDMGFASSRFDQTKQQANGGRFTSPIEA